MLLSFQLSPFQITIQRDTAGNAIGLYYWTIQESDNEYTDPSKTLYITLKTTKAFLRGIIK